MKHWKLLLAVPVVAALAMVPRGQDPAMVPQGQDPADPPLSDVSKVIPLSELQYVTPQGNMTVVSARNVVEIRLLEDVAEGIRLELYYDNGDYSMIDARAFHLLRNGQVTREVKLVRCKQATMRFPMGIQ